METESRRVTKALEWGERRWQIPLETGKRKREYIPITWASKGRVLKDNRVMKVLLFKEIHLNTKIHCTRKWGGKGPGEALWVALGALERPAEEVSSLISKATWAQEGRAHLRLPENPNMKEPQVTLGFLKKKCFLHFQNLDFSELQSRDNIMARILKKILAWTFWKFQAPCVS